MKALQPGEIEGMQTEVLQLRFLSLQSYYDKLRDTKEEIPDWVLSDIFGCKNEIERRGVSAPDFKKQPTPELEEPKWLQDMVADRKAKLAARPF